MNWIDIDELNDFAGVYWFQIYMDSEFEEEETQECVKGTFKQYPYATHFATLEN